MERVFGVEGGGGGCFAAVDLCAGTAWAGRFGVWLGGMGFGLAT